MTYVRGSNLKVGDIMVMAGRRDMIVSLRPYRGPLARYFPEGASTAEFSMFGGGMTINHGEYYEVLP
jgi:hypothetical protein